MNWLDVLSGIGLSLLFYAIALIVRVIWKSCGRPGDDLRRYKECLAEIKLVQELGCQVSGYLRDRERRLMGKLTPIEYFSLDLPVNKSLRSGIRLLRRGYSALIDYMPSGSHKTTQLLMAVVLELTTADFARTHESGKNRAMLAGQRMMDALNTVFAWVDLPPVTPVLPKKEQTTDEIITDLRRLLDANIVKAFLRTDETGRPELVVNGLTQQLKAGTEVEICAILNASPLTQVAISAHDLAKESGNFCYVELCEKCTSATCQHCPVYGQLWLIYAAKNQTNATNPGCTNG